MIVYSLGRYPEDNRPAQRTAASFPEFAADVLSRRARDKKSAGYICAGFGKDGRRCKGNVLPRRFLALDVDGIDPNVLPDYRMYLAKWQGFGYGTASSTPQAPRERVVLMLSDLLGRDDALRVGKLIVQDIEDEFGAAVRVDPCTLRGEQPCFLAPREAQPFHLLGDPLDVSTWLAQAPELPAPPPPATADVIVMADARMRWIVGVLGEAGLLTKPLDNSKGYAMTCPWQHTHTQPDAPGSTATALLYPAEPNGWRGGFACLHSHCRHRRLTDLVEVLRRAARGAEEVAA